MEEKEWIKRARELEERSLARGIYTRTAFLTEGEQAVLAECRSLHYTLVGGYEEAERRLALFGSEEELYYPWESEIVLLKIEPKDQKFADDLSHRDFTGALLNLGIKRELLGDLLVVDNVGYQFCLQSVSVFLQENLSRVRRTSVTVREVPSLPEGALPTLREETAVSASERLDGVVCAVYGLSRAEGKDLAEKEKVFVNGRLCTDPALSLKEGQKISVRGFGKFYYDGITGSTRSGRSRIAFRRFV